MGVERVATVHGDNVRTAEVAGQQSRLPARIREILLAGLGKPDVRAGRLQRALHLAAMHPSFTAIVLHQEPVCAALDDTNRFTPVHDMEHGVAVPGTGVQLQIGIRDRDGREIVGRLD